MSLPGTQPGALIQFQHIKILMGFFREASAEHLVLPVQCLITLSYKEIAVMFKRTN